MCKKKKINSNFNVIKKKVVKTIDFEPLSITTTHVRKITFHSNKYNDFMNEMPLTGKQQGGSIIHR